MSNVIKLHLIHYFLVGGKLHDLFDAMRLLHTHLLLHLKLLESSGQIAGI